MFYHFFLSTDPPLLKFKPRYQNTFHQQASYSSEDLQINTMPYDSDSDDSSVDISDVEVSDDESATSTIPSDDEYEEPNMRSQEPEDYDEGDDSALLQIKEEKFFERLGHFMKVQGKIEERMQKIDSSGRMKEIEVVNHSGGIDGIERALTDDALGPDRGSGPCGGPSGGHNKSPAVPRAEDGRVRGVGGGQTLVTLEM